MLLRPLPHRVNDYFQGYIDLVQGDDALKGLRVAKRDVETLFRARTEDELLHRYAPGKWSPKEILGHLIDCERVFQYRALCFARGDRTELPGFEEDDYVRSGHFDARPSQELLEEYSIVRSSTTSLFAGMDEAMLDRDGNANGSSMNVGAIAWVILGHEQHHLGVMHERYFGSGA